MVRHTKRRPALVLLLAVVLIAALIPAIALADRPGDHGNSNGTVPSGPSGLGAGSGGGPSGSGDPDELGIYRLPPQIPGGIPAPPPAPAPLPEQKPSMLTLRLHIMWAFLLGSRFPGA
jgi:hypothetical protein